MKASVQTEYDYDGMMRAGLRLGLAQQRLQQLSLIIPLQAARARYMHAVADGLRHNYAGYTPVGQGKVWDSSRASKLQPADRFFPCI